jgi:hypothetical protein
MERRMVRIWRAGDQLPVGISKSFGNYMRICPTLQDIKADAAQPVDVWVVDFGEEADLGRSHGVVVGEEQLQLEDAACIE